MITCIRGAAAYGLIVPTTSDQPNAARTIADVARTNADRGRNLAGVRRILWPLLEIVPDLLPVLGRMQMNSTMNSDAVKITNPIIFNATRIMFDS
jgi:hypothetical protein